MPWYLKNVTRPSMTYDSVSGSKELFLEAYHKYKQELDPEPQDCEVLKSRAFSDEGEIIAEYQVHGNTRRVILYDVDAIDLTEWPGYEDLTIKPS